MECYYHPSRESTDNCAICGKSICKECGLEIAGKVYCKECLEKIVGLNLAAQEAPKPEEPKAEEPKPEPVRLAKKEPEPEAQIEMANLTKNPEPEVQFSNQKIADDSPYNIKDSIQYEGGLESSYDENYQPRGSLQQAIEDNQKPIVPEQPVENVREEYIPQEPITQARNEYDTLTKPQAPPADDYIYPDHSYEPEETSARRAVEDKYEKYLDDLYFDEEEVPLNEQLARDEEKFGSLTRNEYQPRNAHEQKVEEDGELERRIREELSRRENEKKHPKKEKIHNIEYEDEKEPFGIVDILLTIILIIVILIVIFYIVYLFVLSSTYPTFIDAIFGLRDPGKVISVLLNH